MLRVFLVLLFLCAPLTAGAASQVRFVSEFPAVKPLHIAVDRDGRIFTTGRNGAVVVASPEGKPIMTLQEKDANGDRILKKPNGIAIDGDVVYVTDTSRDRVVMFSREGAYLGTFCEGGSAPKELKNPEGIFADRGVVYVADYSNDRVQLFGANGVYIGVVGTRGEGEALLRKPVDVAVDPRGYIYAIDGSNRAVKIYKPNGDYAGRLPGLANPHALAMAPDGLFVSDLENGSIVKFGFTGERVYSFGSVGSGKVQFQEVSGIFVDGLGQLYAADTARGGVQVMATEQGAGVGPLDRTPPPTSVRWQRETNLPYVRKVYWDQPRERLYAIDDDKNALLVFKNDQLERTITVPDWTPAAVTVDRQGAVWVVDRGESRVLKLNAEGKVLLLVGSSGSRPGYLRKPRGLAVTGDGTVYVADTGNDRVQAFNSEGVFLNVVTSGAGSTELRSPIAITVDGQGILYVASDSYKTIFSFSSDGKFLRVIGDPGPGRGRLETPVDLLVNGNELFVLDGGTGDVKVFSLGGDFLRQFGARGEGRGDFRKPSSITLLDATRLIVADYGNKRLQYLSTVYTPTAPDELGAVGGMRTVNVRWKTPDEPFVEKYRVYRAKEKPEEFKEVALVKTRSYQDTDVVPNLLYYYRIGAVARDGNETVAKEVMKAIPEKYRTAPPQGVEAQTQEWSVDLKWTPNKETFVDHYRVYREDDEEDAVPQMVGETKATNFSEGGLDSDTAYTYYVSAFSTDGVESERTAIDVETPVATKPPLEVDVLEMSNIFSNTYKIYETEGIGRVRLTNNTRDPIGSLKLSLAVKEFMDFPSELEVKNIAPRESREVTLRAVFNNKVLEVTEDTPVQTEITASYYENQKLRTHAKSHTVNLYEKHRMMWVEKDRIATFVTSKDPVLIEFTRAVVTQHGELNAPLVYAGALFEHLGHMGMTYLQHPTNPYQVTAGKTEFVDYVQYPRETLKRNSGVCTDLVVLYAAALESLGIRTLILGIPGHLFMMFDVGAVSDLGDDTMNGMLAIHDGHIWVPVELTIVGAPFMKAWEVGSKTYNDAKAQGIEVTDLRKAWRRFKPATLPFSDWRVTVASRADVDKRFNNEVAKLNKLTLNYTSSRYFKVLQQNPNDVNALLQLGIIYGEGGELDEALRLFERAERISPDNATIKNNIGNIHLMRGKYADAQKVYENAAGLDTSDPYILVNLAICYLRLEKKEKAVDAFQRAYAMDREIGQKYRAMALELLGGI